MASTNYTRGSLWWANLAKYSQSSVQGGWRPVVIVSSSLGCLSSDIVTVCPLTTKLKDLSININVKPVASEKPQQVLTNQLVTIPKNLLSSFIGSLDSEDLQAVEEGILISLGIAKPVVEKTKASQEALLSARRDREALNNLIPQAKDLVTKLKDLISRYNSPRTFSKERKYLRRSKEEISDFIKEWEDPYNDRHEVAKVFNFNSYGAAYNFWVNHKKKV